MLRQRATKIIATLGPASSTFEGITDLFKAGADLFRLNFSHGSYEMHEQNVRHIRQLSHQENRPIGIIQDLQGPKLRVGTFEGGSVILESGQTFQFDLENKPGSQKRTYLPHPEIFKAVQKGHRLLLNDGLLSLVVRECSDSVILCDIAVGGILSDRKGVNVPDSVLPLQALTPKDLRDLDFGLSLEVDWIALSFVQSADDVLLAQEKIEDWAKRTGVTLEDRTKLISKLEKPLALDHLEEITKASDALLIARGDLGVELPPEEVPPAQKHIIAYARSQAKPVIVATQMLESMVASPTPTRAETSDVANAVYEGVDAVMLSAESAAGQYPKASVEMMDKIIRKVEADSLYWIYREKEHLSASHRAERMPCVHRQKPEGNGAEDSHHEGSNHKHPKKNQDQAIMEAARQVSESVGAQGIVTLTYSGASSYQAAYERPKCPILALTPLAKVANQLCLAWGVYSQKTEDITSLLEVIKSAEKAVLAEGLATKGQDIVITAGGSFLQSLPQKIFKSGTTRVLRILTLGEVE